MTPELYKYWYEGGQLQWRPARGKIQSTRWEDLKKKGQGVVLYLSENFEFRKKPVPREHAELIKAWADGAEIEYFDPEQGCWFKSAFPVWSSIVKYRIREEN